HITASLAVNTTAVARLLHRFYPRLLGTAPFPCLVMGSIAGFMSSPLYAIYGASKAALKVLIESLNVELEMAPSANRILHVAPGNIAGTAFHDHDRQPSLNSQLSTPNSPPSLTNLEALRPLAAEIIDHLRAGHDRFIPHFDEVYAQVLERAHQDFREEGRHSYRYKIERLELRVES
ncbi:MAG: SDR family NAD(P)-dependent oxidoreductase, partial [Bacteroidaceae bacterium]|nr:SDR family NAD(P)-dependent oxidoreductase [Bacteroidaceae bacterium]